MVTERWRLRLNKCEMMQEEGCERLRVEEMLLFKCQRTALCHYKMEDVNDAGVWADAE